MLKLLALDRFTLLLFVMVLLASFVPVSGQAASVFGVLTTVAIAILFFLHGAKLSREAVIQGMMHWKLHALVFAFTFILFPVLGLLAKPVLVPLLGQELYWGFLFMCFLPSTVQSSIAFTSVAQGNNRYTTLHWSSFTHDITTARFDFLTSFICIVYRNSNMTISIT